MWLTENKGDLSKDVMEEKNTLHPFLIRSDHLLSSICVCERFKIKHSYFLIFILFIPYKLE